MNTEKDYSELDGLIDAACNESISDTQMTRLEEIIANDESAMETYIEKMWMSEGLGRLSANHQSAIDTSKFENAATIRSIDFEEEKEMASTTQTQDAWNSPTDNTSGRIFLNWVVGIAACLALIATAGVVWKLNQPSGSNFVATIVDGEDQQVEMHFAAEEIERTELADGTIVVAKPGTEYTVSASRRIELKSGELYLIVAKSNKPFVVETPDGEVHATGTRFNVSVNEKTKAAVAQGTVELKSDRGIVRLGAGQQGTLANDARPTRGPAKRLSYLVNWAKEALKQEERLVKVANTENGLIAVDPNGQEARLSLRQYNVDVYIEDGVARTTIDQTFFNHYPWNTEGTFYFPLPPDASVSRLAMYVFGNLNEGGMVTRERGQEIYTDILHQRRDPALLEMMEGNMFKMRIFPLEGRQEKRIFLSYTQNLDELYGTSKYWFPMDHTNDIAKKLSIKVRIKDGVKDYSPQSSTHEMKATPDGEDLVLEYTAEKIKPDQDFLLNLLPKVQKASQPDKIDVATCVRNGQKYLSASLTPNLGRADHKPEPRQWVVLNDVSASRSRTDVRAQQYILERLIAEADDQDTVHLIDLNTVARNVSKSPVGVRDNASQALLGRDTLRLIGATNLQEGLVAVNAAIKKHKMNNPHLLYLGDGVATDGEKELEALVDSIPGKCKFVGVGVGKKVDSMFLKLAADKSGGTFTTINPNEDIDWRVFDLLASLNTTRMTQVNAVLLDKNGNRIKSIAYPNKQIVASGETLTITAMCSGEFPVKIRFTGKVNGRNYLQTVNVENAKKKADYLPRLWAKRHIDELLKSSMYDKDEIIRLSRDFYVVTPFTSLIVLEDDAMYEEYNVERGRTDHWAKYDAPESIEVIKEPVDWNRWHGWGGNFDSEDGKVAVDAKPKTVQQIVDNVQIRLNAPFYIWNQQLDNSRESLYQICDRIGEGNAQSARAMTLWYLLASGQRTTAVDWIRQSTPAKSTDSGNPDSNPATEPPAIFLRRAIVKDQWFARGLGGGSAGPGLFIRTDSLMRPLRDEYSTMDLESRLLGSNSMPLRKLSLVNNRKSIEPRRFRLDLGLLAGNDSGLGLPIEFSEALGSALDSRRSRLNRDVQKYNKQNTNRWGQQWNSWDSIDASQVRNSYMSEGIDDLLDELLVQDGDSIVFGLSLDKIGFDMPIKLNRELESFRFRESRSRSYGFEFKESQLSQQVAGKPMRSPSVLAAASQPLRTQPGMAAILAADVLGRRLAQLLKKDSSEALTKAETAEVNAIKVAIERADRVGANLEPAHLFWGYSSWNYQPQVKTLAAPAVQAYPHYPWSFDLTRYANGLNSSTSDIAHEVIKQFGESKSHGKISDEAKELLKKARSNFEPIAVKIRENDELLVGPNNQFARTTRSNMHLVEKIICDGKNILHLYDELGLTARREASSVRLASFQNAVPHMVEPAEALVKYFDVELIESKDDAFTLKLTLAKLPAEGKDSTKDSSKESTTDSDTKEETVKESKIANQSKEEDSFHLLVTVDLTGRMLKRQLIKDGEVVAGLEFDYDDAEKVVMTWTAKDNKELGKTELAIRSFEPDAQTFSADVDAMVVFDMPIKKPDYYIQELEALTPDLRFEKEESIESKLEKLASATANEDCEKAISIRRHLALSYLQDFEWLRWGGVNQSNNGNLSQIWAMTQRIKQNEKKGDLTLFGSNGNRLTEQSQEYKEFLKTPLHRFFRNRNSADALWETHRNEKGLTGHIGSFHASAYHEDKKRFDHFMKQFPDSPLGLALATYQRNGASVEDLVKLHSNPEWEGLALILAVNWVRDESDNKKLAKAFLDWVEADETAFYAFSHSNLANHCRTQFPKRWAKVVERNYAAVLELDSLPALMDFAERASAMGEEKIGSSAFEKARKILASEEGEKSPLLLKRFALAQSLWAANRYGQAWKEYEAILKELERREISPSHVFLAAAARLASSAGHLDRAIKLEEQALLLGQPYLPNAVNLQAFRQRYEWLWRQYQSQISKVNKKDKKELDALIARAETTWDQWRAVDRNNPQLSQNMASFLRTAGLKEKSWEYLSSLIDQKPKDAMSYSQVGQWFASLDDLPAAERWLKESPKWDTANPKWILEYGQLLKRMGKDRQAKVEFKKVIEGKWAPGLQNWVSRAQQELN